MSQVRADSWKEVADDLVRDSASNNLLNRIIPAGQTRFNTTSSSSGGMPLFPFSIAINSSATSVNRVPFSSSGTFSQFGSSTKNFSGSNLDRRQENGNRNGLGSQRMELGSITSFVNSQSSGLNDQRNSRNLFLGVGAAAAIPTGVSLSELNLPCLFQPNQWPNFPPLSGSFEECCETSVCYTLTTSLRNVRSEIASYTTGWTTWGPCSATCGGGSQARRRFCIGESCDDDEKQEEENQSCNLLFCPTALFSPWSRFGSLVHIW